MGNSVSQPGIYRGYLIQNATDYLNGNTTSFEAMKKAAVGHVMGQLAGKCQTTDFGSVAKFEALKKLVDASATNFDNVLASDIANVGEAFCNQLKAADTSTELDLLKADPSAFAGKIFDAPHAYVGATGAARFDNQYAIHIQNPTVLIGTTTTGCLTTADCPTGTVCNVGAGFCASSSCTANCPVGAACSSNGMCQSGACTGCQSGTCESGFCSWASTVNPLQGVLKPTGGACTDNLECAAGTCNSGFCGVWQPAGSAAGIVGFYKRNAAATCIVSMNIDAWSGATVVTFGPDDPNNPQSNTFYGGNITLTGSASPYAITQGNDSLTTQSGQKVTLLCPTLTLANNVMTGTCTLGGGLSGSCTINHTRY